MSFVNAAHTQGDDGPIGRPYGFQITSFTVRGKSPIDNKLCQRRLEKNEVVVYVDHWAILVKVRTPFPACEAKHL